MALATLMCLSAFSRKYTIDLADYGVVPGATQLSSKLDAALSKIQQQMSPADKVVLRLQKGEYHFHSTDAPVVQCYISNHDQEASKRVGIRLVGWKNLTLDGKGAELVFHGRLIPMMISECTNTTLCNFSVDFANPQIAQVEVVENLGENGIKFRVAPWVNYRIGQNGCFETFGEGWTAQQSAGIAFEGKTKHIVYQTSDIGINTQGVQHIEADDRLMLAPNWKDARLIPGTVVAMRTWFRPTPGVFMNENENTVLRKVRVHYAEGMGLLAQRCTDITLDGFSVCLKGDDDPRYFTTQADATHFSQCKGLIKSCGGLYEGMMDDAINIHGVYLRVRERIDDHTLRLRYEHGQAWGFGWGDVGDTVTFVRSAEMEDLGFQTTIKAISPDNPQGTKEFVVTFRDELPKEITADKGYGVENLTWTPEVIFKNNVVRNNRARGSLFSSPRRTVCEGNLFDHTSGTAILLCGDCNGWYESGACRDLVIRKNRFVNALTNYFQFTNAVISIYPEIPALDKQQSYFHGGKKGAIVIEKNLFETFDAPILYAKSVDGLVFRGNKVVRNNDYKPFHWNKKAIFLERVINEEISNNEAMEYKP